MIGAVPSLQIRHSDGEEWVVAANWPDGRLEDIASFETETDANEWIAREFQHWLETRVQSTARLP